MVLLPQEPGPEQVVPAPVPEAAPAPVLEAAPGTVPEAAPGTVPGAVPEEAAVPVWVVDPGTAVPVADPGTAVPVADPGTVVPDTAVPVPDTAVAVLAAWSWGWQVGLWRRDFTDQVSQV